LCQSRAASLPCLMSTAMRHRGGAAVRYRQFDAEKAVSMAPRATLTHLEVVSEGERPAAA
jgi:hypothetical protein